MRRRFSAPHSTGEDEGDPPTPLSQKDENNILLGVPSQTSGDFHAIAQNKRFSAPHSAGEDEDDPPTPLSQEDENDMLLGGVSFASQTSGDFHAISPNNNHFENENYEQHAILGEHTADLPGFSELSLCMTNFLSHNLFFFIQNLKSCFKISKFQNENGVCIFENIFSGDPIHMYMAQLLVGKRLTPEAHFF